MTTDAGVPGWAAAHVSPEVIASAERALLANAMLSSDAASRIAAELDDDDFHSPTHAAVHRAISALLDDGIDPDFVSVCAALDKAKVRGIDGLWVHDLLDSQTPDPSSINGPLKVVRDASERRRLNVAGARAQQFAQTKDVDVALEALPRVQADLDDVVRHLDGQGAVAVADLTGPLMETLEARESTEPDTEHVGLRTGWQDVDGILLGLRPGQLVTVGARPAVGKTSFGLALAAHAAIDLGVPTLVFSLEMGKDELVEKLLSSRASVTLGDLRDGQLGDHGWAKVARSLPAIEGAPLYLDDSPDLTLQALRARARQHRRRHGIGFVVVDYLQLLTPAKRAENRQADVAEMSRGLKLLAKQLQLPVLVLAQLNRKSEDRPGKRPMLSDLRESGAVEQDSDVVILLFRDTSLAPDDPLSEVAEVIVAKQRSGPTGTARLGYQGYYGRFSDLPSGLSAPPHVGGSDAWHLTEPEQQEAS